MTTCLFCNIFVISLILKYFLIRVNLWSATEENSKGQNALKRIIIKFEEKKMNAYNVFRHPVNQQNTFFVIIVKIAVLLKNEMFFFFEN